MDDSARVISTWTRPADEKMSTMGSDWSWTLTLPGGTLNPATVERLLALADEFGLSPDRPGGGINGFGATPGREGEHQVLDREQMVRGLVSGFWATNLWTRSEDDVFLCTTPGDASGWDFLYLSLDAVYCRRMPDDRADPFRELHQQITGLWVAIATETGALFGRVEDEWSLEQIWSELPDPYLYRTPPPLGSWPDWLSWSTYFDAGRYELLPPVPAELGAGVQRTRDGAAVIELLTDPAAVDVLRFAQLHHAYRRAVGTSRDQRQTGAHP